MVMVGAAGAGVRREARRVVWGLGLAGVGATEKVALDGLG